MRVKASSPSESSSQIYSNEQGTFMLEKQAKHEAELHVNIHTSSYLYIYMYIYVCIYSYLYIYMYIFVSLYICIYIYMCMYMYIYIYVYISMYQALDSNGQVTFMLEKQAKHEAELHVNLIETLVPRQALRPAIDTLHPALYTLHSTP